MPLPLEIPMFVVLEDEICGAPAFVAEGALVLETGGVSSKALFQIGGAAEGTNPRRISHQIIYLPVLLVIRKSLMVPHLEPTGHTV